MKKHGFSHVEFPWRIKTVFQRKARKFYECECCGSDIIPGDLYYEYKPLPINIKGKKFKADKWRKRCWSCKPLHYDESKIYFEGHKIMPANMYS